MNSTIMTKQYAADLAKFAPILQAYSEGKTIQTRSKYDGTWRDYTSYFFDAGSISAVSDIEYRIKPVPPREWWIVKTPQNTSIYPYQPFKIFKEEELIHVREVI